MMKHVCASFVFKFVGGEDVLKRTCHYCREDKWGGMVCVYSNDNDMSEDAGIFVCPSCLVQGCKESEEQWAAIRQRRNVVDIVADAQNPKSEKTP